MTIRTLPSAPATSHRQAGVVVVGTGAAGMSAALEVAAAGMDVLVVSKGEVGGGSTPWAQGGLAAAIGPDDSVALHVTDTVTAGAGICDPIAVDLLVRAAPGEITRLVTLGARFDDGPLGLEGGHSRHRIVHAGGDASGAEVHRVLAAAFDRAVRRGTVRFLAMTVALDLVLDEHGRTAGLLVGHIDPDGVRLDVGMIHSPAVVLASGGFGQAYATTTNPAGVTGDGLALAVRAGAEVADVEFVQFHPTVLWGPEGRGRRPLITEALRGAGARLVDCAGRSVMAGAHPLGDLAPRDVVSATMQRRMATGDGPTTHLWLDATGVGAARLEEEFPTVTAACRDAGIDPVTDPIPVAPGAHYACGGIVADMDGVTSIAGLYAVGEVASTGLHGANRLASNSLTEALTAGRRVGRHLVDLAAQDRAASSDRVTALDRAGAPDRAGTSDRAASSGQRTPVDRPAADHQRSTSARGSVSTRGGAFGPRSAGSGWDGASAGVDPAARQEMADAMSRHAGVLRQGEGLEHLIELLSDVPAAPGRLDLEVVEATNLHTVSMLVATAALARTESRGCHRRSDLPDRDPAWERRVARRWSRGSIDSVAEISA